MTAYTRQRVAHGVSSIVCGGQMSNRTGREQTMNEQAAAALADLLYADKALLAMYEEAAAVMSPETASIVAEAIEDHREHERLLHEALDSAEIPLAEPGEDMLALMEDQSRKVKAAREEADALEGLMLAERVNAMLYAAAGRELLSEELSEIIAEHHADERMHVSLLAERVPHLTGVAAARHGVACITGGMTDDRNPDDFE
jgi:hypothetical protein